MKVSPLQYVFAYDIPGKICFVGFSLAALIISFLDGRISIGSSMDPARIGFNLLIMFASVLLGFLVAALFICFVFSPFYLAIERLNGRPFKKGDKVYVISGRRKGTVVEVYSKGQGLSVRIVSSDYEKRTFKDEYSSLKLIKIEDDATGRIDVTWTSLLHETRSERSRQPRS